MPWVVLFLYPAAHGLALPPSTLVWPRMDVVPSCPAPVFNDLLRSLIIRGEYCPNRCLPPDRLAQVAAAAEVAGMHEAQALSLRKLLLTERAIKVSGYIGSHPRREAALCRQYEEGGSLVSIARAADTPPVALFRMVFRSRHVDWSENKLRLQLRRALRDPERHLGERDRIELARAMELDCVSYTADDDMYGQRRGAYRLERALQHFLAQSGVEFLTEDEQRLRHIESGGGPLPSTPDLLITGSAGITINGHRVHWLDAKAYFGPAPISSLGRQALRIWLKRTKDQAQRYTRLFGQGALVFALGHHDDLAELLAPEALVLDASIMGGMNVLDHPADVVILNPSKRWSRDELPPADSSFIGPPR